MDSVLANLSGTWTDFTNWHPPSDVMFAVLLFSVAAAFIITRLMNAPRMFAIPVSFMVLLFAGFFANFLGRNFVFYKTTEFQMALALAVVGQSVAAIFLLFVFKVGGGGPRGR